MTSGSSVMNCSKAFLMMLDPHAKDFHSCFLDLIRVEGVVSGIITRFSTCNCCNTKPILKHLEI
jgi:hypothetical protein